MQMQVQAWRLLSLQREKNYNYWKEREILPEVNGETEHDLMKKTEETDRKEKH